MLNYIPWPARPYSKHRYESLGEFPEAAGVLGARLLFWRLSGAGGEGRSKANCSPYCFAGGGGDRRRGGVDAIPAQRSGPVGQTQATRGKSCTGGSVRRFQRWIGCLAER